MKNAMFSAGYSDLNAMYNEVCPPHSLDENMFQPHQSTPLNYPTQFSSAVDHTSQQMPIVPYGVQQNDHRSYSPGMSSSSNDLRNMGIPTHFSAGSERHASPGPHSLNSASKPDMQWMVTTSHIDMRSITPPNAVVAHSSMHQNPLVPHSAQKSSSVRISHSGYTNPSSSTTTADGKPRLTKSGKPRGTPGRKRKVEDHDLAPEEAAKRRLRRERNKLAAAKCRNRRRELTDRLQGETDILEDHQGMLTREIMELQQEKDHLEFLLASHAPVCKVLQDKSLNQMRNESPKDTSCMNTTDCLGLGDHHSHDSDLLSAVDSLEEMNNQQRLQASTVSVIQAGPSLTNSCNRSMGENMYNQQNNSVIVGSESLMASSYPAQSNCHRQDMLDHRRFASSLPSLDIGNTGPVETLNTPVCSLATPSNTSSVFTFPNTPCVTSSSVTTSVLNSSDVGFNCGDFNTPGIITSSSANNFGPYHNARESCAAAHRRSSSSEPHTSPDSVKSPKLLSL